MERIPSHCVTLDFHIYCGGEMLGVGIMSHQFVKFVSKNFCNPNIFQKEIYK
jgi:hypothetical protein